MLGDGTVNYSGGIEQAVTIPTHNPVLVYYTLEISQEPVCWASAVHLYSSK